MCKFWSKQKGPITIHVNISWLTMTYCYLQLICAQKLSACQQVKRLHQGATATQGTTQHQCIPGGEAQARDTTGLQILNIYTYSTHQPKA